MTNSLSGWACFEQNFLACAGRRSAGQREFSEDDCCCTDFFLLTVTDGEYDGSNHHLDGHALKTNLIALLLVNTFVWQRKRIFERQKRLLFTEMMIHQNRKIGNSRHPEGAALCLRFKLLSIHERHTECQQKDRCCTNRSVGRRMAIRLKNSLKNSFGNSFGV